MISIGLTGGIGAGKSTCAEILSGQGIAIIDTDQLARELVEPGQPALEEIRARFGQEVVNREGVLRRDLLSERVFSDPAARRELEAILHPRIRQAWEARLETWRTVGVAVAWVVVPLLFEAGLSDGFDHTVCVACRRGTQRERLGRRGWSEAEIDRRLSAQLPISEKMARANRVIWNEGPRTLLPAQLRLVVASF